MVQLREKDLPPDELLSLAHRLRSLTMSRVWLFINGRVDVALASAADGVQLGEEALTVEAARRDSGGRLLIGRSVHSAEGAATAETEGAGMLVVGTIFPTGTHPGRKASGLGLLEQISVLVSVPFLGIGGVNAGNVESVIGAGASGVAVVTAITESGDPKGAAAALVERAEAAWTATAARRVANAT